MPTMNANHERNIPVHKRTLLTIFLIALAAVVAATATAASNGRKASKKAPVQVQVFSPQQGDIAGRQSKGFFVDLALRYPSLAAGGGGFTLQGPQTPRPPAQ